jgi:glycosyltransferase involved in cell wall biosynthesis
MVRYRGCDDAVRMVSRFGGEWHLMLCGDGPFRGELAALAEANGVRDRVHFTGLLDDVRQAYAAMNVFLYLARYDSFGLAVGEAMAAGVPVFGLAGDGEYRESEYPLVTSDNSSFVERSQPTNYAGPEDPEVLDELARRIEYYAPHPERYRPMIEHARGWVRERFNADTQARKVTEVYNAVLQRL